MANQASEEIRHQVAIAGTVRDLQTAEHIGGVILTITNGPPAFLFQRDLQKKQYSMRWQTMVERIDRTRTAPDGLYYFLDLPDGQYTLEASLPGSGTRYGSAVATGTVARDDGNILLGQVDMTLAPTTVEGQVTKEGDGGSDDGVQMAVVRLRGSGEQAYTDQDGHYALTAIETGERTVDVSAQGYQEASSTVMLDTAGSVTGLDVTLTPENGGA